MLYLYLCHPGLAFLLKVHEIKMHLLNICLQVLQDAVCTIISLRYAIGDRFSRHLCILHRGDMFIDLHRHRCILHLGDIRMVWRILILILNVLYIALQRSDSITSIMLFLNHYADIRLINFEFTAITLIMRFIIIAVIQLVLDPERWWLTKRKLINFCGGLDNFILLWTLFRKIKTTLKK